MRFATRSTGLEAPDPIYLEPDYDRPLVDSMADAFALENSFVSLARSIEADRGEYDPEFNAVDHITDENREYGAELVQSINQGDFDNRWTRIQEELAAKERLDQDGGWGILSYMTAGVLDPINLIPIGGAAAKAYKGGNILRGLLFGAEAGLMGSVATEAILQGTQLARTAEESAINIAAGTFMGGVLGGAFGAVKSGIEAQGTRSMARVIDDLEQELYVATGEERGLGGSAGAADPKVLPREKVVEINKSIDDDIAAGKLRAEEAADETIRRVNDAWKELSGFKETIPLNAFLKVAPWMKHTTPTMRGFMQESVVGREIAGQLMETGMSRAGSEYAEGAVDLPVEAAIKLWEGKKYRAQKNIRDAYYEYRTGKPEMPFIGASAIESMRIGKSAAGMDLETKISQKMLTVKEFNEEVAKAARSGDTHVDPVIQKTAQMLRREVLDPIKELAIEVGYLPKDIAVNPKTADSYLNRVWDTQLIESRPGEFLAQLKRHFADEAHEAQIRVGEFDRDVEKLRTTARVLRAKQKDIEVAVKEGIQDTINQKAKEAIEAAGDELDIDGAIPTAADVAKAEEAAALRAYNRVLRKELTDAVKEAVEGELDDMAEDVIDAAIARAIDEEEAALLSVLKEEISTPMADAGAEVGEEALSSSMRGAEIAAAEAAQSAAEKSYKAITKKIERMLEDAEYRSEVGRKKLIADAKREATEEARRAGRDVMRNATKEISEKLQKAFDDLAERRKQQGRDVVLLDMMETGEIDEYAQNVMHRITATGGIRPAHDIDFSGAIPKGAAIKPGAFKRRSLLVRDEDFSDFMVNDIEELVGRLIDQTAPTLELRRTFGSSVFEETEAYRKLVADWQRIGRERGLFDEAQPFSDDPQTFFEQMKDFAVSVGGKKETYKKWDAEMRVSINDFKAVFERLKGTYGLPETADGALNRTGLFLRQTNFIRMLGGVVISAIPDMARPLMVHGVHKGFARPLGSLLRGTAGFKLRARDIERMNIITEMISNSRVNKVNDIGDPGLRRTRVEQLSGAASDTFGYVSGASKWNHVMKTWAALASHDSMLEIVEKWARHMDDPAAPMPTKKEIAYLKDNYIDAGAAQDIWKMVTTHGDKHSSGYWIANIDKWDNVNASNRFRAAMHRDVDRTIITPGQDIPLWASKPVGKLIFQFKSFAFAASEKMLLAGLQQNDRHFYSGVLAAIALGSMTYVAKEKLNGKDPSMDIKKLIVEGIDRSGVMGWLMEPNNFIEKVSNGHIGLGPWIAGESLSRYQSRNAFGAALGPSFGSITQVLGMAGYLSDYAFEGKEPTDKQVQSMMRLLPYSNVFYLRLLLEATSD